MASEAPIPSVLAEVGPRLKKVRSARGMTLQDLSAATGISKSTLSRLESGQRKATLELLLPISQVYEVPLEALVGAPTVGDPRIQLKPRARNGRVLVPLTEQPSGQHAWKVVIPPEPGEPTMRSHEGYEWLYVLRGQLRLLLDGEETTIGPGGAAEFDTKRPHWFGSADGQPVEIVSLLGRHGEHIDVRGSKGHK